MKLLFVVVTLVCVVLAHSLPTNRLDKVVSPKCADPTYSCQDLATARSCGVVKSCIYDVWATMSAPEDNNEVCDICKNMVQQARDQLLSNMTQDEIKQVFEGSCRLMYFKPVVDTCIKIVDDLIPELIEMLASRMDPNMVCTVCGLCNVNKSPVPTSNTLEERVGDNLTCEFCENLVQHLKDIISSNTTEEEIKTALLNFCHQLGGFSDECTKLINDNFDKIYELAIHEMDPHTVCTELGLCDQDNIKPLLKVTPAKHISGKTSMFKLLPASFIDEELPLTKTSEAKSIGIKISPPEDTTRKDKYNMYKKNGEEETESNDIFQERLEHPAMLFKQDTECAFCKAMMFFLKNDLKNNRTEVNVKSTLDSVCSRWLAGYSKYCHSFLKQNYIDLEELLTSDSDFSDICAKINICPKEENGKELEVRVIPPKVNNFIDCEICKKVVSLIREELQKPNSKEAIERLSDKLCNFFPQSFQDSCRDFIHQNIDTFINLILKEIDPDSLCHELNFCAVRSQMLKAHVSVKNEVECELCKEVVQMLDKELDSPTVKEDVKNALDKVCTMFPDTMVTKCQNFINENIDMILSFLKMEMNPDQICSDLRICPGLKTVVQKLNLKKDNPECTLCKAVMKFVQEEMEEEATEEEIKVLLDKACSVLPSTTATKCKKFIDDYAVMIASLIGKGMDPSLVCSTINMCSNGNLECSACQSVFHFLQTLLYENDTQVEIKNFMKRFCSLLPGSITENCEAFVDEYGSSLLVILAQELDPSVVCVELDLCASSSIMLQIKPKSIQIRPLELDKCTLCTTVVDYVDKLLENDDIDKEITGLIEKVCNVVPRSVHDKCASVIEAYGPYILQMIGQLANSKEVCQDIDMCPRTTGQVHLLGGNKCAFGPSYWCASKAHAAACKAEIYCKQNDWKI